MAELIFTPKVLLDKSRRVEKPAPMPYASLALIIELPKEKKLTHKGDYSNNKELSEGAILNLKKWYKDDFDLYYFILENKKNWNIGK